ncbi:MAG TPA: hypothetical protein VD835_16430 [Pyrinomonadaceae bacterium]|nr:hypothetical protein [Pyrinomonadaceae bacterium]
MADEVTERENLLEQARALGAALGIQELDDSFTADDIRELEKTLSRQHAAVRRFLRRWDKWEDALSRKDLLERALAEGAIAVDSDHVN